MRTSLNKLQLAEEYLFKQSSPGDALVFEANMILDEELRQNVAMQKSAYTMVQQYGRKKLKAEIEAVHQQLFTNSKHKTFADSIRRLFGR